MPVISGGGGAGGPAAGSYLPVANKAGVTVDTTTYADPIKGSGFLTTLVFPSDQGALAIAASGDSFPRLLIGAEVDQSGIFLGNGSVDPTGNQGAFLGYGSGKQLIIGGLIQVGDAASNVLHAPRISQLSPLFTITDTALPTFQLVSGAATQNPTSNPGRDIETVTPCTFNPGAATTATVTVALSPDNTTYSTLAVVTEPAGVALDGTILPVKVRVPAGWYLKLTVNAQAVLGLTTYY